MRNMERGMRPDQSEIIIIIPSNIAAFLFQDVVKIPKLSCLAPLRQVSPMQQSSTQAGQTSVQVRYLAVHVGVFLLSIPIRQLTSGFSFASQGIKTRTTSSPTTRACERMDNYPDRMFACQRL